MEELRSLIGTECELEHVPSVLRRMAESLRAAVVGGYHVTCSDETERECAEAFRRRFVEELFPALKSDQRAVFRTINLGGRYEQGAIQVAEEHYAVPPSQDAFKLMVVKINSHVAVEPTPQGPRYGWLQRYGCPSPCCGALRALLDGVAWPAIEQLQETFCLGGRDRVAALRDPLQVPPEQRALRAAITNARLQAELAVRDLRQQPPKTPTVFLVVPCVTINRPGPDRELIVGQYGVDWTGHRPGTAVESVVGPYGVDDWSGQTPTVRYHGLGDDPTRYRIRYEQDRLRVEDDS
jgi:hypothetical protein